MRLRVAYANVLVEESQKETHAQLVLVLVLINGLDVVACHRRNKMVLNGKFARVALMYYYYTLRRA